MPGLDGPDPAPHLTAAFHAAFPTWRDLTAYLAAHATTPAFDTDRAARQLVMTDLLARFTTTEGFGWILRGSLALPARPTASTGSPRASIAAVYATARPAFDIDLCATTLTRADPAAPGQVLRSVAEQIIDTGGHAWAYHGVGLGGLIHYASHDLRVLRSGRVVAQVTAQPLDPRRSSALQCVPVDDPLTVHIDLSPPGSAAFPGAPESARRPIFAIPVPGFADIRPDLYPTANQIADKLALTATPHWNPPWHRFKDLFDLYYLTTGCRVTAAELRAALETNPNLARHGLTELPHPYRLHGSGPEPGQDTVDWAGGYERLRSQHPALSTYPEFSVTLATLRDLANHLANAPDAATWNPANRRWSGPDTSPDRSRRPSQPTLSPPTGAALLPSAPAASLPPPDHGRRHHR
jgi:hypothetical protein